jgi:hypothetical protein
MYHLTVLAILTITVKGKGGLAHPQFGKSGPRREKKPANAGDPNKAHG